MLKTFFLLSSAILSGVIEDTCADEEQTVEGKKSFLLPIKLRPTGKSFKNRPCYAVLAKINRREVVLKHYETKNISESFQKQLETEVLLHAKLKDSPNVIQMINCVRGKNYVTLIFERTLGSLATNYNFFYTQPITDRLNMMAEITEVVQRLHQEGYIYSEISPEMLLINTKTFDSKQPKVSLKIGKLSGAQLLREPCKSFITWYSAPEMKIFPQSPVTAKFDSWSLALTAASIFCSEVILYLKSYSKVLLASTPLQDPLYGSMIDALYSALGKTDLRLAEMVKGWIKVLPQQRPELDEMAKGMRELAAEILTTGLQPAITNRYKITGSQNSKRRRISLSRSTESHKELDSSMIYSSPLPLSETSNRQKSTNQEQHLPRLKRRLSELYKH